MVAKVANEKGLPPLVNDEPFVGGESVVHYRPNYKK